MVFIIDWRVVNNNGSDQICETPYSKHEKHKHLDVGGASSSSTLPTASTSSAKKAEKHKKEKKAKNLVSPKRLKIMYRNLYGRVIQFAKNLPPVK